MCHAKRSHRCGLRWSYADARNIRARHSDDSPAMGDLSSMDPFLLLAIHATVMVVVTGLVWHKYRTAFNPVTLFAGFYALITGVGNIPLTQTRVWRTMRLSGFCRQRGGVHGG